jgi:arylsulfatase
LVRSVKEGNERMELYNLSDDPRESTNVAAEHPDIVERLWKNIRASHELPANGNPKFIMSLPD